MSVPLVNVDRGKNGCIEENLPSTIRAADYPVFLL